MSSFASPRSHCRRVFADSIRGRRRAREKAEAAFLLKEQIRRCADREERRKANRLHSNPIV